MTNKITDKIVSFFEFQVFGVCAWIGEKLGIKTSRIRLYFIYLSFFTFGSPVIIYLVFAFLLEHKEYFKPRKSRASGRIWEL